MNKIKNAKNVTKKSNEKRQVGIPHLTIEQTITAKRNRYLRRFIVSEKSVTERRNDHAIREIAENIGALNTTVLDLTEFTNFSNKLGNKEALKIVKDRMNLRLDLIKEHLKDLTI